MPDGEQRRGRERRGGSRPTSFYRPPWKWPTFCGVLAAALAPAAATAAPAGGAPPPPAPTPPGGALTLSAAIEEALRAAPAVLAAGHETAAAQQQVRASRGQRYGELDALLTAQHLNDPQLLRPISGPLTPAAMASMPFAQDQVHLGALYTYPLYDGGRITNQIRISELGADRAKSLLAGTRSDTVYNVTALFAQGQALGAQADAIQREIEALEATRRDLELAVRIGKRPEVDLLKVIDRISEAQAHREEALAQQKRLLAALMAVLGRDAAQAVALAPLPERLPEIAAGQPTLEAAAARRSSVTAANLAAAQSERQVAVARAAQRPALALQASYFEHADPGDIGNSRNTWFVGLQVSLPLFDGGTRHATVSKDREEAAAARQRADAARLQAAADLQGALAEWQAAQQQLTAANAQYDSAREVARIEQLRFDTGAGDIEDLLRARSREVAAQSAQIAARSLIIVSGAQINRVVEQEVVR